MWKISLLFLFIGLSIQTKAQEPKFLELDEFYIMLNENPSAVIVDVREWKQFKKERIEGAQYAASSEYLYGLAETYGPDEIFLFYGENAERARMAAQLLYKKDFKYLYILYDSYSDWKEKGFPIERTKLKKADILKK